MPSITLRQATPADRDIILTWANDPVTRAMSFDSRPITPSEHATWYADRLADPHARLYIVEQAGEPVGLVRFVRGIDGRWELGINLAFGARSQGIGADALRRGMAALRSDWGPVAVWARSRPENQSFARAATSAGFVEHGPTTCRDQAAIAWVCEDTGGICHGQA